MNKNNTTRVGSKNAGYTIVASVRMHSDAFEDGLNEDMTICLGVNENGSMVSWKAWHTEERLKNGNIGWGSGSYQPNREGKILKLKDDENNALEAFKEAIAYEMKSAISRTKTVSEEAAKDSDYWWAQK